MRKFVFRCLQAECDTSAFIGSEAKPAAELERLVALGFLIGVPLPQDKLANFFNKSLYEVSP
jgi:hypothetical protein